VGVAASAGFVLGRVSIKAAAIEFEQEPIPLLPVPAPEDEDVCCRQLDGLVSVMFLSECRQNRGKPVERKVCSAALKPVCCKRTGLSDWSDAQGCARRGGSVVDDMSCRTQYDLVCCEFPRTPPMPSSWVAWAGRDQCTKDKGTERPRARCEDPLETVCCQQPDAPAVVAESTRQNCQLKSHREVPPEQCTQVCCHHKSSGTRWEPRASCTGKEAQAVMARECDDVCCRLPNKRSAVMKEGDCRERGGASDEISQCGTTVEVEKPREADQSDPEAPQPPSSSERVADRPPATTPYM
jgi:hypothetical protein